MLFVYLIPIGLTVTVFWLVTRRRHALNRQALEHTRGAGLTEPASLHPLLDPTLCIGCGACTQVCPTGAIRIEDNNGVRRTIITGTVVREQPLPKSAAGKILKRDLRAPYWDGHDRTI